MIAVGVLHLGLLWLLSQSLPVQRAVRYVVVHYVQPVSSSSSSAASSRAITPPALRLRSSLDLPMFSQVPQSSLPQETTRQLA